MKTKPKKPTKKPSKKLSARARKQDVPNAWYHSLKKRVENLEGDVLALEATLGALVDRVHGYLKGKRK